MFRKIEKELLDWKTDYKKPLMLIGARQTGKTYIIEKFCKENFPNYIYINLEKENIISEIFDKTVNPEEIIEKISLIKKVDIDIQDTIIFLDEIQVNEKAITSLKYFCENARQYHIIAAGSLLGVALHEGTSFPVGKVDFMDLYPLNFQEFLLAIRRKKASRNIK